MNIRISQRESNIELLRILTIMGVIVLHWNNPEIGGGFKYTESNLLNCFVLHFIESIFIVAVNVFMLISGYFMCVSQKRMPWKAIRLIFQVEVFKIGIFMLQVLLGNEVFSLKGLVATLLPTNYFVILYVAVFFISPFINVAFRKLDSRQMKLLVIVLILIFSVWNIGVDIISEIMGDSVVVGLSTIGMQGSQSGYTFVNFTLMYCVGAYLRLGESGVPKKSLLLSIFFINVVILAVWANMYSIIGIDLSGSAYEYCNPIIIINAAIIFILFKQTNIKYSGIINYLSKGTFTVFLTHSFFLKFFDIEWACNSNVFVMIVYMIISVFIIYMICQIVHFVYEKITAPLFKYLEEKFAIPYIYIDVD